DVFDHADEERHIYKAKPGLSEELVREISKQKNEPQWVLDIRLKGLRAFQQTAVPTWGPDLSALNFDEIIYYARPDAKSDSEKWDEVPADIKKTFDRLGIPKAEQKYLAGAGAQYDSNVVYHNLREDLAKKGVIFEDMDVALQKYPELVKKYFMTRCIPVTDHKFIMLHAAVWSGGSFIYVPKGVKVDLPLQAYFRMNAKSGGQFEHTLIIVEDGAELHYIEGCSAALYSPNSLHAGCVEIYVGKNARMRYSSVENWSKNTYNLNTKRAVVDEHSLMEWVSAQTGSGVTMLYPCSILKGADAKADHISIAVAGKNQHQDTGAKVYHLAPRTTSIIRAKSISKDGGISAFRGHVKVNKEAVDAKVSVKCDALQMDDASVSNTFPYLKILTSEVDVAHEATVGRIDADHLFYLMSRGLDEEQAMQLLVAGFIETIVKELPLEYAVELNRLIALEMESH
ncbi:MAG: Fe-S cluster assembly protein SufB, partial [archaeon]|nr:Fe-S cluster assembly protein SufB [archaeon]